MRLALHNPHVRFVIGDIRDRDSIFSAMRGVDYVFHAAALKHVPQCEFFPYEAVKTNVIGAMNVLDAADFHGVKKVVVLSTDKAVYPINAMGQSKALMEKLMIAKSRDTHSKTTFCAVRYGNVMYSRGSVIPLFVRQIKEGRPITLTQAKMTRFLLPLPYAVDLVLYALAHGNNGDIFVKKAPASTTEDLARACLNVFNAKNEIREIGIREGEKMHETLISEEESIAAQDLGDYFKIKADRTESYEKYTVQGHPDPSIMTGYTSANTQQLSIPEIEKLLRTLKDVQRELR
jgi:UDP-glucose 4-epimerase